MEGGGGGLIALLLSYLPQVGNLFWLDLYD